MCLDIVNVLSHWTTHSLLYIYSINLVVSKLPIVALHVHPINQCYSCVCGVSITLSGNFSTFVLTCTLLNMSYFYVHVM